jgi:uncharacterized protein (DUF169 family)
MDNETNTSPETFQWPALVDDLNRLLRLRTTPIGMKWFANESELESIPKLRRPNGIFAADQIVGQAARLNWTIGVTGKDLVGTQCAAVLGLGAQDADWQAGKNYAGVWYETPDDAADHQTSMACVPHGQFEAMAVAPLASGRLDPPDICLIYATPAQMILFINGLQWSGFKKLDWGCVGESACADSWGRAMSTGEPSLSIPCYAERRYGGVMEDELLMALPPHYLPKVIEGLERLSKNGLRYPIPAYGLQNDVRAGMGFSYPDRE